MNFPVPLILYLAFLPNIFFGFIKSISGTSRRIVST
jgi:hypothetical protein